MGKIKGGQGRSAAELEADAGALLSCIGWGSLLAVAYALTLFVKGWMGV
jgi:hypothetical protein